jgi:hypothetical protein
MKVGNEKTIIKILILDCLQHFEQSLCHLLVCTKGTAVYKLGVSTFYMPRSTACLFKPQAVSDQNMYTFLFCFKLNRVFKKVCSLLTNIHSI